MKYNKKLLGRANAALADLKEANSAEHERRIKAVYSAIPEIEETDARIRQLMAEVGRTAFSRREDRQARIDALHESVTSLQMRRAELLVGAGYPYNWLDEIISCPLCRDTGYTASGMCACLKKLYNMELTKSLSALLRSGDECFERFDLSLYPDEYLQSFGCNPREYMGKVLNFCRGWAESFSPEAQSLIFIGKPGLGKTFLSACIARAVAQQGYTVCYDTAVSVFTAFEMQQFARSTEDGEAASEKVDQMLTCDLLILDDIGTEVLTPVVQSAFYTLVNTRLGSGLATVLNTNLYPDDFRARYSAPICSRIDGCYKSVSFFGNDIRQILKK